MAEAADPTLESLLAEVRALRSEVDELRAERHRGPSPSLIVPSGHDAEPLPALEVVDRRGALQAGRDRGSRRRHEWRGRGREPSATGHGNRQARPSFTSTQHVDGADRVHNLTGGLPAGQNIVSVADVNITGSAYPAAVAD